MRPLYESLVAMLKEDISRVDEYAWRQCINDAYRLGDMVEQAYLKSEVDKIRAESLEVRIATLRLGVNSGSENYTIGSGPIEWESPVPEQLELSL